VVYALGETGMVLFSHNAIQWELLSGNFWTSVLWIVQAPSGVWYAPAAMPDSPEDKTVPLWMTNDGAVWNRSAVNASVEVLLFIEPPIRCKNSMTYVAFDSQFVYVSNDLATWDATFSADYQNLQSVTSLYSTATGYVLTAKGPRTDELYTSADNGATWQRVNMMLGQLYRVYPVSATTWLEVQIGSHGYWFVVSRDSGKTWTNTSAKVSSIEVAWLSNSKAVLHLGQLNVTTASITDLTAWTTQKIMVTAPKWLVFHDTFYAISRNETWSSADGISWATSEQPYFTEVVHTWGVADDAILGVGSDGVAISAQYAKE